MKKKHVLLPFIAALLYIILTSNSSGPGFAAGLEKTGATSTASCNNGTCHSPSATATTTIALTVIDNTTSLPVTTYVSGRTYTIRINGAQTGAFTLPKFGFQLSAVTTVLHTSGSGTLTATAGTHTVTAVGLKIVEQTGALGTAGGYVTGTGTAGTTYSVSATWTAPVAGSGGVTFFSILNAVNGNGAQDAGDKWNNTSAAITELTGISGPSTVCVGSGVTLTDATAGGTWSGGSGFATVAGIGTSATVTGTAAGVATISYTLGGSTVTKIVSVNGLPAAPAPVTGTGTVCVGATTALTDATGGGTWSSVSPGVGSVSATGIVTGISGGTTTISYTESNSCGSIAATTIVTVNSLPATPAAITGTATVCAGATTALTDLTGGGTWSSTVPGTGTVDAFGVVTGISAGTTTISYTETNSCGSIAATKVVTVNSLPAVPSAISGTLTVCTSAVTSLSDAVPGGTWTSTNPGIGTVGTSGIVTGISAGTTTISYTITNACGSNAVVADVTVNTLPAAPAPISGTASVCAGATTSLSDATASGTWSSTNPGIGTIGTSGIFTGLGSGTTTVSYTVTNGCGTAAATIIVTVNSIPTAPPSISGTRTVCDGGATTSLSDAPPGGTWSSTNTGIATVGTSGTVTSVSAGTTTISYTVTNGCGSIATTAVVTVNSFPAAPGSITGTPTVCAGSTTSLTDITAGGTWSSTSPAIGTVGTSGIVTGLIAGTTTISYTLTNSCGSTATTTIVTVNPLPATPAVISGTPAICLPGSASLSDATPGGVWSSTNTGVATIGTDGTVTGVSSGTTTISYTESNSCGSIAATVVAVVSSAPVTPTGITGTLTLCSGGATTPLTDATAGGTWTSTNTGVATVGSTGIVTSVSTGTTTISYTETNGCGSNAATAIVTVNPLPVTPAPISGITVLCAGGASTSLTDVTSGGIWSSTNTGVATVGTSGIVTSVGAGTTTISYTESNSCGSIAATTIVTVNPLPATPAAISGTATVCNGGATTALSNTVAGGAWSSTNTGVATVGGTGIVTSVSVGTTTISYTESNSCGTIAVTINVTVNPLPAVPSSISGTTTLCAGATTALSDAIGGGSWTSTNTSVATISTAGLVTGISGGTTTISYTTTNGCGSAAATTIVTVNPLPSAGTITGSSAVCTGSTIALTDATAGGTWFATNTNASVSGTGVVTGNINGTDTVLYRVTNSCGSDTARKIVTVTNTAIADPISGPSSICLSTPVSLSDGITGGTWISGNTSVATIGSSSGIITGVAAGTTNITYTVTTSCGSATAYLVVTVGAAPSAILGTARVCTGATTSLSDATTGGTWSSSNTLVGTVGSLSGTVSGITAGTTVITYASSPACRTTVIATVNQQPAPITGAVVTCPGNAAVLSDPTPSGNWTSNNTAIATIGSVTGIITGVSAGTVIITYQLLAGGCFSTFTESVNPLPGAITGTTSICAGLTSTLSESSTGGLWSSGNISVGTVGSTSGIVTAISGGTTVITYALPTGCITTTTVTVTPQPTAILGTAIACVGATNVLSDVIHSGIWSSTNTSVATVGSVTGIVTGVSAGTSIISYQLAAGCYVTTIETINPSPATITGTASVCAGSFTSLSNSVTGGTWSSSNVAVGTIGSTSGILAGLVAGTSFITYMLPTGCKTVSVATVNLQPGAILGTAPICAGSNAILSDAPGSGTWSSANTSVATIGSITGIISGLSSGTTMVTYQLAAGCFSTAIETVNVAPAPISGTGSVCAGAVTALSSATSGGTWSSSNLSVATIGTSGILSGLVAGTTNITYTLPTGCRTTTIATVNLQPGAILGITHICNGANAILSDAPGSGTWSSSNTSVATIGSITGIISGSSIGTTTITYQLAAGCFSTTIETVDPLPSAISGIASVCAGASTSLSDTATGGTWSSSNVAVGTIGSASGILSGLAAGTTNITYTLSTGCKISTVATVNLQPGAVAGPSHICSGANASLSDIPGSGTWTSSNSLVATVGSVTGILSGLSAGTATITYQLSAGCFSTATETIDPLPAAITGTLNVCAGAVTTMSDDSTGGTWTSSNIAVGTIDAATGILSGLLAGTTGITYTPPTGCKTSAIATVNTQPGAILGAAHLCSGSSTTLSDPPAAGGTWSSSNTAVAAIGSATGVISALSAGTVVITFRLPAGCFSATVETVDPLPAAIVGTPHVCEGAITAFSNDTAGGSWSSGNIAVGTIGTSGILTGLLQGTTTISYILPAGCATTIVATVNLQPASVLGTGDICVGTNAILSDSTHSGIWTSSNTTIATIGSVTGIMSAVSAGTTILTYQLAGGCFSTAVETVDPLPAAMSGTSHVCEGATITLSDATPGGSWASSNPARGSIDAASGVLTGILQGTVTVSYTSAAGCSTTAVITVNPQPAPVGGNPNVCPGSTEVLSDAIHGGLWSSSNSSIATVGSVTGIVNVLTMGSVTISYIMPGGCFSTILLSDTCTTGVLPIAAGASISIFPNPNNGAFFIRGSFASSGDLLAEVIGIDGKIVYKGKLQIRDNHVDQEITLDNTLANGIYLLRLHSENESTVLHFVIRK